MVLAITARVSWVLWSAAESPVAARTVVAITRSPDPFVFLPRKHRTGAASGKSEPPYCMCGRPLEHKGFGLIWHPGRVRSCVRPLSRPMTAGPDGFRRTGSKHGCGFGKPVHQAEYPFVGSTGCHLLLLPFCSSAANGQAACGGRR